MGKFSCRCGYRLGGSPPEPGTAYQVVADELFEDVVFPPAEGRPVGDSGADAFTPLHHCPNCDRLHWERNDGTGRIRVFVADAGYPRIRADLSDRDEFGRVLLRGAQSVADIARQRLLLRPPLRVVLVEDGAEFPGEANYGPAPGGGYDETLWAVILDADQRPTGPL